MTRVRVSIPSDRRIVDAKDARNLITTPKPTRLYGYMYGAQVGGVAYVTLDGGRDALVMRDHLTIEPDEPA